MTQSRVLRVGLCTERFAEETIKRMLETVDFPCKAYIVNDIEDDRTRLYDTLLFINPVLSQTQIEAFDKYIRNGTTAIILISGDTMSHGKSLPLLQLLGVAVEKVIHSKKIKLNYTDAFPNVYKKGRHSTLYSEDKHPYAMFSFLSEGPNEKQALITYKHFFTELFWAVQVWYDRGTIVIMNSYSFAEDRADIVSGLLTHASENKIDFFPAVIENIEKQLPTVINEALEVYETVSLSVIAKRVGIDNLVLEEFDFLQAIEELIRNGDVHATIREEYLVRAQV